MYLPERLRLLREAKNLSQGDIEKRTGLLRCYISRVENGHTTPSIETLEKLARACEVSLYQIFYEGESSTGPVVSSSGKEATDWASRGSGLRLFTKIQRAMGKLRAEDRELILHLAKGLSGKKRSKA